VIYTINGGTKPVTFTGEGVKEVTIVGNKLSSVEPVATGDGISLDEFEVNETATSANIKILVEPGYSSGSVSYMGRTIAIIDDAL
jgi:hypothetical protein